MGEIRKTLSADGYRELFGAVPAAVAVVTTGSPSGPHGTTVSAFGPISLDPPLVQVCLDRSSNLLEKVSESQRFAINVLAWDQEELARRFARSEPDDFAGLEWSLVHGSPCLGGCHGWVAATVERVVVAGDHSIVIGLAHEAEVSAGTPLLYHARTFRVPAPISG